jgi:hypothetical protein
MIAFMSVPSSSPGSSSVASPSVSVASSKAAASSPWTRRAGPALAALAFAVAFVVELLQPLRGDATVERFVAAAQVASRDAAVRAQPGDLVLVHPPWRDDVVDALRAAAVVPASMRVTEVFAPRHGEPLPAMVLVADEGWPLPAVLRRRIDTLDAQGVVLAGVRVVRLPAERPASASPSAASSSPSSPSSSPSSPSTIAPAGLDLARAQVHVTTGDGTRVACPWTPSRRRHVCAGLPGWMTVGDDTLVIGGRRERCTWAHPITGGVVVVDFGAVPTPPAGWQLSLALSDAAADNPAGAPVTATLVVDDDEAVVTVQRARGFHAAVVAEAPLAARVQVRLSTPDDGQRHVCFRLQPAPAGAP